MKKENSDNSSPVKRKRTSPPPMTDEGRENEMIYLAEQLAEKQLREGTASSQVIVHYLKLGSSKEKLEKAKLEKEVKLVTAKTESLESQKKSEEMYAKAIKAMQEYSGKDNEFYEGDPL